MTHPGPEAVRTRLGYARTLYEYQEFNVAGTSYGEPFATPGH